MVYRVPQAAPESQLPSERRGKVLGRFCSACGSFYPLHCARHAGKPMLGKDHVASTCAHEGDEFTVGEGWWEPAVEVLPAPPVPAPSAEGKAG